MRAAAGGSEPPRRALYTACVCAECQHLHHLAIRKQDRSQQGADHTQSEDTVMSESVATSPRAVVGCPGRGEQDEVCVVCFRPVEIYSVGECDHPVCYECSTRMRVLCARNECPICRKDMAKVRVYGPGSARVIYSMFIMSVFVYSACIGVRAGAVANVFGSCIYCV